jgi:hypothetical protein
MSVPNLNEINYAGPFFINHIDPVGSCFGNGTADLIGFWGAQSSPVVSGQLTPADSSATKVAGSGTAVTVDTQFQGVGVGTTGHTLNDIVTQLKAVNLLKN